MSVLSGRTFAYRHRQKCDPNYMQIKRLLKVYVIEFAAALEKEYILSIYTLVHIWFYCCLLKVHWWEYISFKYHIDTLVVIYQFLYPWQKSTFYLFVNFILYLGLLLCAQSTLVGVHFIQISYRHSSNHISITISLAKGTFYLFVNFISNLVLLLCAHSTLVGVYFIQISYRHSINHISITISLAKEYILSIC